MSHSVATVATIGSGSMGESMALLFSEKGDIVSIFDTDKSAMKAAMKKASDIKIDLVVNDSIQELVDSFDTRKNGPRIIILSLPHGKPVDGVAEELLPKLEKGDVVMDGGNEWWEETERRQKKAQEFGVHWIGIGVSGGYQSARHGPSMSPGCTKEAYEIVKPRLMKWAAKDRDGQPCVGWIGPGGAGHYVKMMHNGIEQGHLSILAEAHHLLHWTAGMTNAEVADVFDAWNGTEEIKNKDWANAGGNGKELYDNFLVKIGAEIMRFKHGDGIDAPGGIVDGIEDKVTQDIDNSEGTGTWSLRELAGRHIPAPTIAAAHQLRLISGPRGARQIIADEMKLPKPARFGIDQKGFDRKRFVEEVRLAVYAGILGAYVQGMNIIAQASEDEGWDLDFALIIRIWRGGCIIQSTALCNILEPLYLKDKKLHHLLQTQEVANEFRKCYDSLKNVCRISLDSDSVTPALDATLGWLKSIGGAELPTNFEEGELDYFGHHNYDLKSEDKPDPVKGKHHTEFKPA